jgi:hypothetical protein
MASLMHSSTIIIFACLYEISLPHNQGMWCSSKKPDQAQFLSVNKLIVINKQYTINIDSKT